MQIEFLDKVKKTFVNETPLEPFSSNMRQNVSVTPVLQSPRTLPGEKIVQTVVVSGHILPQFQISFSNKVGYTTV